MHIDDTQLPFDSAWEGELAPPEGVFAKGDGLPTVSLGRPAWWSDGKVLGKEWVPPAGGRRYGLARFAFSLRPGARQEVKRVEFVVHLHAKGGGARPVVFDLFPKAVTEEQTGTRTLGLDPKFKFVDAVEVSGLKAETTINVRQAVPVITADGVGESVARWVFQSRPAHPLIGSQSAYVVVELPPGVAAARASLLLSAEVTTRFGPMRGLLPEDERERLSWVLE
jgi:hypothetical protein